MKFPTISGSNLEGKEYLIPKDLEGDYNLLIIAFRRWHQKLVDDWVKNIENFLSDHPSIRFYEIPLLNFGYTLMKFVIDGGMRAGIPSIKVRKRTITVYTNKSNFMENLGISDDETIHLYFIDKNGEILWKSSGNVSNEKLMDLKLFIKKDIDTNKVN